MIGYKKIVIVNIFIIILLCNFQYRVGEQVSDTAELTDYDNMVIASTYFVETVISEDVEQAVTAYVLRLDIPLDYNLQYFIHTKCIEKNIDENLVYALIWSESRFVADVISKTGDYGLMQINAKYHFEAMQGRYDIKTKDEMLGPQINVDYGIDFISDLVKKHGVEKGVAKYKGSSKNASFALNKFGEYQSNY